MASSCRDRPCLLLWKGKLRNIGVENFEELKFRYWRGGRVWLKGIEHRVCWNENEAAARRDLKELGISLRGAWKPERNFSLTA